MLAGFKELGCVFSIQRQLCTCSEVVVVTTGSLDSKKSEIAKKLLKHGKSCDSCKHYEKDEAGPPIGTYSYCALEAYGAGLFSMFHEGCDKWSLK